MRPDDPRLAGLSPEDLATINFNSNGQPDYVPRQPVPGATVTVDPGTQGRGQFTAEQSAAIDAAAYQAAGFSGDAATADYIRQLQSGALGGGADTQAALERLIAEGKARNVATFGVETGDDGKGGGGGGGGGGGFEPRADARNTIRAVLATYFKEKDAKKLSDFLYGVYARGEVDINNPDALIFSLREQDAYKERFAANAARAKKGLAELDPASYLALENSYRQLLQSNGLPSGFYDQTEDFTALLEGDVSPQELQTRVQQGFRAVQDADPEVKRQMQELYGVNEAGLAAYFLDPTKAAPILTRQAEAAKIAARAKEQGRIQLLSGTAEEIAARGITAQEAEAGFTAMGLQEGLYTEMFGEQALTQQQKVGAALGYDVAGQQGLKKRQATRKAEFGGGGSFAKTTGQTSGTVQTGLGVAE
jgi:hypothetical protein